MKSGYFVSAMKRFGLFIILIWTTGIQAQDFDYARLIVDTLSSPSFHGRGYVNEGEQLAAEYIRNQFEQIGLEPIKKKYFQTFSTAVNTFPGAMQVAVNGKELQPGLDYLVEPGSPGITGTFDCYYLTFQELTDPSRLAATIYRNTEKLLVVPTIPDSIKGDERIALSDVISFLKYSPDMPAAGVIILTESKLTWSGSTQQFEKPTLTVRSEAWPIDQPARITVNIEADFISDYSTQNVIGILPGKSDSTLVFTAHYDHLGRMGQDTYFPGANDNASGVALLLNLAKEYAAVPNRKYRMVFIAFGAEEIGLVGSRYFVEHPLIELNDVKFLLNFDISGTGDEGIQVVNGKVYRDMFDRLVALNNEFELLPQIKIRGEACNSDHCFFHQEGVPGFFIYTLGGIKAYHDVDDKAATLPLTAFTNYFTLLTHFINSF